MTTTTIRRRRDLKHIQLALQSVSRGALQAGHDNNDKEKEEEEEEQQENNNNNNVAMMMLYDTNNNKKNNHSNSGTSYSSARRGGGAGGDGGDGGTNNHNHNNIYVKTARTIKRGECIMACPAMGIAIEPTIRARLCSFCASWDPTVEVCSVCNVLAFCAHCANNNNNNGITNNNNKVKMWHCTSGFCSFLKALQRAITTTTSSNNNKINDDDDESKSRMDSTTLLTFLCLYRNWWDHHRRKQHETPCPLPRVDWKLFDNLYYYHDDGDDDDDTKQQQQQQEHPGLPSDILCQLQVNVRQLSSLFDETAVEWLCDASRIQRYMSIVVSNSHAITNVSMPLGHQHIGRGLFLYHSFYNHACGPSAHLSCLLPHRRQQQLLPVDEHTQKKNGTNPRKHPLHNENGIRNDSTPSTTSGPSPTTRAQASSSQQQQQRRLQPPPPCCTVVARTIAMKDMECGEIVSLSYIPLCGLSRAERQERLRNGYGFTCTCHACTLQDPASQHWESLLALPSAEADVDSIRQIEYSIDNILVLASAQPQQQHHPREEEDEDDEQDRWGHALSMVRMIRRGIANQQLPPSHEVCIEVGRLEGLVLGRFPHQLEAAARVHAETLEHMKAIGPLFDPLVKASLMSPPAAAIDLLRQVLGRDHPWVLQLQEECQDAIDVMSLDDEDDSCTDNNPSNRTLAKDHTHDSVLAHTDNNDGKMDDDTIPNKKMRMEE